MPPSLNAQLLHWRSALIVAAGLFVLLAAYVVGLMVSEASAARVIAMWPAFTTTLPIVVAIGVVKSVAEHAGNGSGIKGIVSGLWSGQQPQPPTEPKS